MDPYIYSFYNNVLILLQNSHIYWLKEMDAFIYIIFVICFHLLLRYTFCETTDTSYEIPFSRLYERGSECKSSKNQWKISEFDHLACYKYGIKYEEYSCPVNFSSNETFTLCDNQNFTSVKELQIPKNTTVLCLGNTKLTQIGSDAFVRFPKIKFLNLSHNEHLNSFASINRNAFRGLNNCVWIDLSHSVMPLIEPMTFSVLPNLVKLDLSFWRPLLPFFVDFQKRRLELNCLEGLNYTKIQELNLDGVNFESLLGILWEINPKTFKWLRDTNLKYLSLADNQIISIKAGVLSNLNHLEGLNISFNILSHLDYEVFLEFYKMNRLLYFDFSYQHIVNMKYKSEKDLFSQYTVQMKSQHKLCYFTIGLPPNIQTVIAAHKRIGILNLHVIFDDVVAVCVADSNVTKICWEHLKCVGGLHSVLPFPNLKVLSIRESTCKISKRATIFEKMVSLEYLDMNGFNKDEKENIWDLFLFNSRKLLKLRYLDMGNMGLCYICDQCLKMLPSLQQLYLDKNQIIAFDGDISLLPNLEILNISNNQIAYLTESNLLDLIKYESIKAKKNSSLMIILWNDLGYVAGCDQKETFNKLCKLKHIKLSDNICTRNFIGLKKRCQLHFLQYIFCYMISLLFLVAIISFKARFFLRSKCYSVAKIFARQKGKITHDAYFICDESDIIKMQCLYRALENIYKYKLFIFERDTTGGYIMDALAEPFTFCSKIILVLSKNAIKGVYFKYLINLCKDYRDRHGLKLIVIFIGKTGQIRKRLQCKDLDYLLSTSNGIRWNTEKLQQTKAFWEEICEFLGPPMIKDEQFIVLH